MTKPLHFSRREFIAASAATALVPQLEAGIAPAASSRPVSYLVILADQLTWWMCDPAQRGVLALPNIDRLRAEGTLFDRCYANSPWCPTSRSSLRNGLFSHANPGGIALQQPAETVEFRLREAGLATRYLGKWHLSPNPTPSEFVQPADRLNWDWFVGHEKSHQLEATFVQDDPTPLSTAPWDPAAMTDFALRMLREDAAQDRPFFMHVNYLPPHQPYAAYPPSLGVYTAADAQLRPNSMGAPGVAANYLGHYMNLVRSVDIEVGRLLDELEVLGTDVVVVFTSDHGDMLWSQGLKYKRVPYEESVRVPLIVRGPGWQPGVVNHPVGLVDLARTFAGIGQGLHLRHWRDSVYFEMPTTPDPSKNWSSAAWRGLVTDDGWKLAIGGGGARLLFDLSNDPYELKDRSGKGLIQETELEIRMREWARATGDDFFG